MVVNHRRLEIHIRMVVVLGAGDLVSTRQTRADFRRKRRACMSVISLHSYLLFLLY